MCWRSVSGRNLALLFHIVHLNLDRLKRLIVNQFQHFFKFCVQVLHYVQYYRSMTLDLQLHISAKLRRAKTHTTLSCSSFIHMYTFYKHQEGYISPS